MVAVVTALGGLRGTLFFSAAVVCAIWGGVQTARLSSAKHDATVQSLALEITARQHAEYVIKQERETKTALAAADAEYTRKAGDAKTAYDRSIADIRRGTLKLRSRFTCPTEQPESTGTPGRSNGEEARGLQTEDAEFLVSEAERADETARALKLAQDTIKIYQELLNGKER